MTDLNKLMKSLTIQADRPSKKFTDQIKETEFTIFDHLSDLGYFSWDPKKSDYKSLNDISSSEEILSHINLSGKPDTLKPVHSLTTPKRFENPPDREILNKFPFGKIDIACLYAAVKVSQHNMIHT